MKKLFLLILVVAFMQPVWAQENNPGTTGIKNNIIKLNLPALAFKSVSVQYERAVAKKISVAATFRYMPDGSIPFKNAIMKLVDDDETEKQISDIKVGNFAVIPEVRFYLGKKGVFRGFYLGPFASFAHYNMEDQFEYTDNGTKKTIPLKGDANSITGGLMIGAQYKVSKSIFVDLWILGANYGQLKGDINGQQQLTSSEQQALRDVLADTDLPFVKITYQVDSNGATVNFNGPWAGVRSGICIGFNF